MEKNKKSTHRVDEMLEGGLQNKYSKTEHLWS